MNGFNKADGHVKYVQSRAAFNFIASGRLITGENTASREMYNQLFNQLESGNYLVLKFSIALRTLDRQAKLQVSGRSVVWLARLVRVQEVVSSNLTAPTIFQMKNEVLKSIRILSCG